MQRINFDCFSQPALGVYGNTPRNWLRQPGINNWDMGIGKNFRIAEHVNFKLNGDFFNAWNHHQYAIGTGALIGSGSGRRIVDRQLIGSTTAGQITSASALASSSSAENSSFISSPVSSAPPWYNYGGASIWG